MRTPIFDQVTLKDFRCFHAQQSARLAPITFLVGDNSTGKTSLLASIRTLNNMMFPYGEFDFKEDPYDLGSFDEIAHHRGSTGSRAEQFEIGLRIRQDDRDTDQVTNHFAYHIVFSKSGSSPEPIMRITASDRVQLTEKYDQGALRFLKVEIGKRQWTLNARSISRRKMIYPGYIMPTYSFLHQLNIEFPEEPHTAFVPTAGSTKMNKDDWRLVAEHCEFPIPIYDVHPEISANAPVRSRPKRTYDPDTPRYDPSGSHVPMRLASLYYEDKQLWNQFKQRLERFGKLSGLFDDIDIRPLGRNESEPFQIQIRKLGKRLKGPPRNLVDMGYGVSQVLPLVTDLLQGGSEQVLLLQQPEVHLHPSAQASLGTFFCEMASQGKQLIVETHSDYIVDRVRMEIRDKQFDLKPEDISILFFDKPELDTVIHSIEIDEEGYPKDPPPSYRTFFLRERGRLVGF